MVNITKTTEKYVSEHPHINACLKKKMINYSSLARTIIKETELKQKDFDAIIVSARRFFHKIKKKFAEEKEIIELLKKSKFEIKNKIGIAVLERDIHFKNLIEIEKEIKNMKEVIQIVESRNAVTVITNEEFLDRIKKAFPNKIIKIRKDAIQITIKSHKDIEKTPGVVAYLYSLFGDYGINILETHSCYTDTLIVIEKDDLNKTMDVLRF